MALRAAEGALHAKGCRAIGAWQPFIYQFVFQLSIFNFQFSTFNFQLLTFNFQFGYPLSIIHLFSPRYTALCIEAKKTIPIPQ